MLIPYFINFLKHKNNMKKYILLLFLAFGSCFCKSQNMPNFNRNYDFYPDYYTRVFNTIPTDTGYYLFGTTADSVNQVWAIFFAFTDIYGNIQRFKKFSSPLHGSHSGFWFEKIDNDFMFSGNWFDRPSNIVYSLVTRVDAMGDVVWEKHFINPDPAHISDGYFSDCGIVLPNNKIAIKQYVWNTDICVMHLDYMGDTIQSSRIYAGQQENYHFFNNFFLLNNKHILGLVKQTPNGYEQDFVVYDDINLQIDYTVTKTNQKKSMYAFAQNNKILVSTQKDLFGVNTSAPNMYTNYNILSNTTIRGNALVMLNEAKRTFENSDGSFTVLGTNTLEPQNDFVGFIARVSENGQLLWQKGLYMPQHSHIMYNAAQTADGGYIVCGDILGPVTGYYQQGWLMKIDSFGCVLPNCHLATEEALETKQPAMLLYPNPATTHINIHIALPEGVEITPAYMDLIDNKGRVLETNKLPMQDMNYEFYLYNYVPGNYFIRIRQGNKQATKQFVKVRG
jgi:Secretion system C-terminal sorting domain